MNLAFVYAEGRLSHYAKTIVEEAATDFFMEAWNLSVRADTQ
jgi:hypothetical protein